MEKKRKFHKRIVHYFKNDRIRNTIIKGIAGYLVIVLIFGILFYLFDSLSTNIMDPNKEVSLFDYLYFSLVTFQPSGMGKSFQVALPAK